MMFKIADGRECFYQWDLDRQLIVSDPTIKEVHFCNRTDVCSLVVEVVDGVANVPNKLLQSGFDVRVFGYDGKATMHEATFEVKARTQPADYVYTETVVKSIDEILEAAETVTTAANEFYEFVEDHTLGLTDDGEGNVELVAIDAEGGNVDLTDYYTKTEVNELIENIDIPETDLTGYATETYVNEAIANIDIPKVDLEPYAKKTDIPDVSKFISEIPDEYITESELNAKGYATKAELNDKANTNHTHTGYAKTNHTHSTADIDGLQKALNNKATQADIDKAIELHDHRYDYAPIDHNHGDEYAAKSHVHSYNSLLDKPTIPSVEGLASEAYVDAAIKNIEISDVSNLNDVVYVDSTMDWNDIKNIIRNDRKWPVYVTGLDTAEAKFLPLVRKNGEHYYFGANYKNTYYSVYYNGYDDIWESLKEGTISGGGSVDLTGYATEEYVDNAIAAIEIPEGGGDADLSNYYTKEETYSKTEVDDLINNIEIPEGGGGTGGAGTPVYNHHINIGYGCKSSGSDNANNSANLIITTDSDIPFTKATLVEFLAANNHVLIAAEDYAGYYPATGGIVLDRHEMSSMSATEVTPTEVIGIGLLNNTIRAVTSSGKDNKHTIHVLDRDAITSSSTDYYECFHDKVLSAENIVITGSSGESADLSNYYTKAEVDELIPDTSSFITEVPAEYITETELNNKGYLTEHQSLDNYYTKDETYSKAEVDEALANAGGSGGGSVSGDYVSYGEAQELTTEQKKTAKANMGLPYVVSEPLNICTNNGTGVIATSATQCSLSISLAGASTLSSLPVGTKFTITIADTTKNPTFTETVECELTSSSSFKYLTDVTGFVFFDAGHTTGSIGMYNIDVYKNNTSGIGFPSSLYITIVSGEFEVANTLDSRLVDLSNYATKKDLTNIAPASGGGKTVVTIRSDELNSVNPEVAQHIDDLWDYAATGKNPLEKYDFQYFDVNNRETYKLLWINYSQGWFEAYMLKNTELYKLLYGPDTYGDRILFEYQGNIKSTLKDWSDRQLNDLGSWVIGWCGEFALMAKLTVDGEEFYINSHVVLCNGNWANLLYDHTNEKFLFNMPANLDTAAPYWYWDGEKLVFEANGNTCELVKVFVKGQYV